MKKFWRWVMFFFIKTKKEKPKKKRAKRIKTLWPSIKANVELWEECLSDTRCENASLAWYQCKPKELLKEIYENIPYYGAYCASDEAEICRITSIENKKIDVRGARARTMSMVHFGEMDESKHNYSSGRYDPHFFKDGITVISAVPCSDIPSGWYVFNTGVLFSVKWSHWTRKEGHSLHDLYVVIGEDGSVNPLWKISSSTTKIKGTRTRGKKAKGYKNYSYINTSGWVPMGGRKASKSALESIAAWFTFNMERNAHWNCTVKSEGVPPIAFPVMSDDIARIFPKRQRDGSGKVVHWTRTHKRKTKDGYTNVKAHIRGNTWWEVDNKSVRISMPGKHHDMTTENAGVIHTGSSGSQVIDDRTGLEYNVVPENALSRLLRMTRVTEENIDALGQEKAA
jgi:hypothetical protein